MPAGLTGLQGNGFHRRARMYLLNAFSLQMIAGDIPMGEAVKVSFEKIERETARTILAEGFTSAIGHADFAAVIGSELGMTVAMNRVNVSLKAGESAIVAQYVGGRLPEGATALPEGAAISWFRVSL